MTAHNTEHHRTAFTVSVDARDGISTGISAADRATTISKLVDPATTAADLRAPRPRVPAPLRRGRRAAPPRSHRGRRGPGPAGRAAGGGRAMRGGERRRHDGPAARAARVRQHPRPGADLDRAADRVPPAHRAPAQPPGADPDPERLRPVAGVRLPARDRRTPSTWRWCSATVRTARRADQAALGVPDRRRVRLAALRLRRAAGRGHGGHRGRGPRGGALPARARGPRGGAAEQAAGLRAAGRRRRHGGRQHRARLAGGRARVLGWRADARRPGRALGPPANQQPGQGHRPDRLRRGHHRPGPAGLGRHPVQPALPDHQAGPAGPRNSRSQ